MLEYFLTFYLGHKGWDFCHYFNRRYSYFSVKIEGTDGIDMIIQWNYVGLLINMWYLCWSIFDILVRTERMRFCVIISTEDTLISQLTIEGTDGTDRIIQWNYVGLLINMWYLCWSIFDIPVRTESMRFCSLFQWKILLFLVTCKFEK